MISSEGVKRYEEIRQRCFKIREPMMARLERYEEYHEISKDNLRSIQKEVELWIAKKDLETDFHKLDTCWNAEITGLESGKFMTTDFTADCIVISAIELMGGKEPSVIHQSTHSMPEEMKHPETTASTMFNFIAQKIKLFTNMHPNFEGQPLGFVFAFPCIQRRLNSAILCQWTKDYKTGRKTADRVEGQDVGHLMTMALRRAQVNLRVNAIFNDTTTTLTAGAHMSALRGKPPCCVGVVIGHGFNCCFIPQFQEEWKRKGKIINLEIGDFSGRALPQTYVDMELDFISETRKKRLLEKMVSGVFLGEICRRNIVKVLQHRAPASAWTRNSLTPFHVCQIVLDVTVDLRSTKNVLMEVWKEEHIDEDVAQVAHRLCKAVMHRSQKIIGAVITAVATKTGLMQSAMGGVSVSITDKSFLPDYQFAKGVENTMRSILGELVSESFHTVVMENKEGVGCAIALAASEIAP